MANKIKIAGTTSNTFQVGSQGVTLNSANVTAPYTLTLPETNGNASQFLQTDGNGVLSWGSGGGFITETFTAVATQTVFVLDNSPTGNPIVAINGITIPNNASTVSSSSVNYVSANNETYVIQEGDLVTISYMYGTNSTVQTLGSLSDVNVNTPLEGQSLTYDAANGKWTNSNSSGIPAGIANGTTNIDIASADANIAVTVNGTANVMVISDTSVVLDAGLIPNANVTYDLGNTTNRWKDLYLSGNTIYIGQANIKSYQETVLIKGLSITANGAVDIANVPADGGLYVEEGIKANGGIEAIGNITSNGGITAVGNISSEGAIEATGNITAGNVVTANEIVAGTATFTDMSVTNITITGNTDVSSVNNGNSNVFVNLNSNVTVSARGQANILTIAGSGTPTNYATTADALVGATDVLFASLTGLTVGQTIASTDVTALNTTIANVDVANLTITLSAPITNAATTGTIFFTTQADNLVAVSGNLSVSGKTNLGAVGNLTITGGSSGQVLSTDGAGTLSWAAGGGGGSTDTISSGNSNVFVNANANVTISSNGVANVMVVSATQPQTNYTTTADALVGATDVLFTSLTGLTVGKKIYSTNVTALNTTVANVDVANLTITLSAGITNAATTGTVFYTIQENSLVKVAGALQVAGGANLGAVGGITITGGSSGQVLSTDGAGNLSWSAGGGGGGGSSISNGTSNVDITAADGNVTVGVNGTANVLLISETGIEVDGDALITGDLTVQGTTTTVNQTSLALTDPVISEGGTANGSPLTTNDGKDRGLLQHYFNTTANAAIDAFLGWDNSNAEFAFGSNVTNANNVMTFNEFGNIRANTFIAETGLTIKGTIDDVFIDGGNEGDSIVTDGNGNLSWGAPAGLKNGSSNIKILQGSFVTMGVAGTANVMVVKATATEITGNVIANGLVIDGNVNFTGNDIIIGNVAKLHIYGGDNGQYLKTDGNGNLAFATIDGSTIVSGNSNVKVTANGNVGISSAGNANILVVTGTGANVDGTMNITGDVEFGAKSNLNAVGNVTITGGSDGEFLKTDGAGNLSFSDVTKLANGTSNVVVAQGANVTISSAGAANVLVISGSATNTNYTTTVAGETGDLVVTLNTVAGLSVGQTIASVGVTAPNTTITSIDVPTKVINITPAIIANAAIGATYYTVQSTGALKVSGNLEATGAATVGGNIDVTGAATVGGNAAITGATTLSSNVTIGGNVVLATLSKSLKFTGGDGTANTANAANLRSVTIQAANASTFTANYTLTLPPSKGTSGQFLSTDGNGTTTWATASGGGGAAGTVVTQNPAVTVTFPSFIKGSFNMYIKTADKSKWAGLFQSGTQVTLYSATLVGSIDPYYGSIIGMVGTSKNQTSAPGWDGLLQIVVTGDYAGYNTWIAYYLGQSCTDLEVTTVTNNMQAINSMVDAPEFPSNNGYLKWNSGQNRYIMGIPGGTMNNRYAYKSPSYAVQTFSAGVSTTITWYQAPTGVTTLFDPSLYFVAANLGTYTWWQVCVCLKINPSTTTSSVTYKVEIYKNYTAPTVTTKLAYAFTHFMPSVVANTQFTMPQVTFYDEEGVGTTSNSWYYTTKLTASSACGVVGGASTEVGSYFLMSTTFTQGA